MSLLHELPAVSAH